MTAEQFGHDTASPALINQVKGALCINEDPQPPTWAADPPAGLIAVNHSCLAQFFTNGLILALYFGSESIQGLGKPTGTQLRLKQSRKMRRVFRIESPLALLRSAAKARGAGSELDAGSAGGQRHLQRMAGTDILTTPGTGGMSGLASRRLGR
jgi:hypothetical protein